MPEAVSSIWEISYLQFVCYMLFAAKLQAGERTQITALKAGTLVLTNIALQTASSQASLFLQTGTDGEILVVTLAAPGLTAYHTEIQLSLPIKGRQALTAKNGSICLLGHFIPEEGQPNSNSIDEVLSIKREDNAQQSRNAKPRNESAQLAKREANKTETTEKQEEEKINDAPSRRSQRARTPAPPSKPETKSKKQVKFSSGSKGKSLLELMYNINDDDDEEESDYSEEQGSSSSSSSSSDVEDSDQTPKRSSKKDAKQQKIQRKDDVDRSEKRFTNGKVEDSIGSEYARVIKEHESNPAQEQSGWRQTIKALSLQNAPLADEMKRSLQKVTNKLLNKVLQEMPPFPKPSPSEQVNDCIYNNASPWQSEQALWRDKYRKLITSFENRILSFSPKAAEERIAQDKQMIAKLKRAKEQAIAFKAPYQALSRKADGREGEGEKERDRQKKEGKGDQPAFAYHIPTTIPDFVLKK